MKALTMSGTDAGLYVFTAPTEQNKPTVFDRIRSRVHWVDLILVAPAVAAILLSL
jgi:hypothetical protein